MFLITINVYVKFKVIFGKCNNEHGHGHNYTFEAIIKVIDRGSVDLDLDVPEPIRNLKFNFRGQYTRIQEWS